MRRLGERLALLLAAAPLLIAPLLIAGPLVAGDAPDSPPVDHIAVYKAARVMDLLAADGHVLHRITGIQLGFAPTGAKHFQGDGRTPEGRYTIDFGNPASAYHLSLHISYPSPDDAAYAERRGHAPGGAIFIHGQPNGYGARVKGDWTDGCIALSDDEIEYLWQVVGDGTPIEILA